VIVWEVTRGHDAEGPGCIPVVGIRPGFITLQVTVDFFEISLRACSSDVITLH
jgi:hypothetical protein